MPIALFLQAIQALTGSQFVKDKLQRSEHVIRVLRQVGLDPEHPPEDFEGIYAYAIVEYGIGKPVVCLEIFRAKEIREAFRQCFDGNDPQGWVSGGAVYLRQEGLDERLRAEECEGERELVEFAAAFLKMAKRSQTPKETLVQHQLRKIERTIDRKLEQVAGQLEALKNPAALSPGETLALASANCRAAGLAGQMREWFEVLGFRLEGTELWEMDYFEWVINIPKRRGFDRVLVRGIAGEAGVRDVMAVRESVVGQRTDEGWLVSARRISQAARVELEKPENKDLMGLTFDELLDQDADFGGYVEWLEREIVDRKVEARYVPLACSKEEFDPVTHQRLGVSQYGEGDGWTEGYINLWLDDPAKEHLSILGEFGTGKTWLTLHYALTALRSYQEAKNRGAVRPRLPIVIPLRDYAKAVSVESLFSEFFFRKHEIPIPGYSAFEKLNRMGKLLLIFDGFDEMAARVDKQQMINNFWELAKVVVPGSKVILTCRTEHFPEAREGRSLLNAELQASTRGLSGETPQFEVLELEKFEDEQIRRVLGFSASEGTIAQVMGNPQLLDLARRPVMTELILEALPDIEAGKPVDMSRVYLYAVRRKMERDIRAERTFTSMADKLYFLCELSWEMLSNDRMSLNYREFPDRIRRLFGSAVQEEKDLDHWHYDMMGQTMLIRNSDGDYTPAHRSLLEFFVAFKFAAELGALAPDFLELAQMKSGIDRSLEPRDYTWSEYFGGGAIAPLKGFVTEKLEVLRSGFGKEVLSKAVMDLLLSTLVISERQADDFLVNFILNTKDADNKSADYTSGNISSILVKKYPNIFNSRNLSRTVILGGDFTHANLSGSNFSHANLSKSKFKLVSSSIFSIAFDPSSDLIAFGDGNGAVKIFSINEGTERTTLISHSDLIWSVAISEDSKLVASAGNDNKIVIFDTEKLSFLTLKLNQPSTPLSIVFDEENKSLISAWRNGDIAIWNIESGCLITIFNAHIKSIRTISFDKKRRILVSASNDGEIKIWNIASNTCIKSIQTSSKRINEITISPDGKLIACDQYNSIMIFDLDGNLKGILEGHDDWVYSVAFSHDGELIATGSRDRTVKVWDLVSMTCLKTLEGHTNTIHSVRFSSSSLILGTGSFDNSLRLWDIKSGENLRTIQGKTIWIRALSPFWRSQIVAIGDDCGNIRLWDKEQSSYRIIKGAHDQSIYSICVSNNDSILISSGYDKTIKMWDVETCTCLKNIILDETVYSLAVSSDNTFFASAHHKGFVQIWDVLSGDLIKSLEGHNGWVKSVKIAENNRLIASCGSDKTARVWDVDNKCCVNLFDSATDCLLTLDFHSSSSILAIAGYAGSVSIWDFQSSKIINVLEGHTSWIRSVAFKPKSNLVASAGNDATIRVWDIFSGNCLMILRGHTSIIESIVFTPDGTKIISCGRDSMVKIWDVSSGQCLKTFRPDNSYEGMNITGIKGLNPGTIASLKALGAVEENEEVRGENVE